MSRDYKEIIIASAIEMYFQGVIDTPPKSYEDSIDILLRMLHHYTYLVWMVYLDAENILPKPNIPTLEEFASIQKEAINWPPQKFWEWFCTYKQKATDYLHTHSVFLEDPFV